AGAAPPSTLARLVAPPPVREEGDPVPTRRRDTVEPYSDHRARARVRRKVRQERVRFGFADREHLTPAVETDDQRLAVEGAEHDRDPSVVTEMRDRLDA